MKKTIKLAFVIPRYSQSIGGGAETLMRSLALALKAEGIQVDILTTCALDHRTWANHFSSGKTYEDDLCIHRFSVDSRNLEVFIKQEQAIAKGSILSIEDQIAWMKNSVNSTSLYEFILEHEETYDLFFFAPYLFATSFWGSLLVSQKAVLVPCLHDEPYAYLPIFRNLFKRVAGIMWNAFPESQLAQGIYNIERLLEKGQVVGMGFETTVIEEKSIRPPKSYFLYSGRKESGKGLDVLIRNYVRLKEEWPDLPELILIGSGQIDFLSHLPLDVVDLGFVSEKDKLILMRDAICLFQPSLNESFSIVLMEAWGQKTPVIVNGDCAVTRHHVELSGGGLHFRDFETFKGAVRSLLDLNSPPNNLGIKGNEFVRNEYNWESVINRFSQGLKLWM